ncbi:40S ribosomal protein S5-1 [Hordeum vulgare]|nr:40S ribosomal protein S5-1 [Hordeum vulgare]
MHEVMLHIRDVEGPKKTGSMEARLKAMEQQVFKCQGMVEHGLNANHMMITEFTSKHMIDANDIGKHLSRLYDKIDHLQAQIYDLQNQNCVDGCTSTLTNLVICLFCPDFLAKAFVLPAPLGCSEDRDNPLVDATDLGIFLVDPDNWGHGHWGDDEPQQQHE